MSERRDPLLNVCLEEVLGGVTPPDLTTRILEAMAKRGGAAETPVEITRDASVPRTRRDLADMAEPEAPPIQSMRVLVESATAAGSDTSQSESSLTPKRSRQSRHLNLGHRPEKRRWLRPVTGLAWFAAAALVVAAGTTAYRQYVQQENLRVATGNSSDLVNGGATAKNDRKAIGAGAGLAEKGSRESLAEKPSRMEKSTSKPDQGKVDDAPNRGRKDRDSTSNVAQDGREFGVSPAQDAPVAQAKTPKEDRVAVSDATDQQVVATIDDILAKTWEQSGVSPAEKAKDDEWCRRLFLRLLGRIPTVEEVQRFATDTADGKEERLVDQLMNDPAYIGQYSQRWAEVWANVLLGRTTREPSADREGMVAFLQQAIQDNVPYDQLAERLITASGSNRSSDPDFNGAVNFILANQSDRATLLTAKTSQIFLGLHLQCVQCHQHPTGALAQANFWEMNSFFRQLAVERIPDSTAARVVDRDFRGEGRNGVNDAEVYFEQPDGRVRAAYPVFLDGTALDHNGRVSEVDRRSELARMIVQSDRFGKAMVNRIWAHFFGEGFSKPIDDIGEHNPPSHPELLDYLAKEFAGHQYDMKKLVRWVALSGPFSRSSRMSQANQVDSPESGNIPLFSRYYVRQLDVEELAHSLELLAQGGTKNPQLAGPLLARRSMLQEFSKDMGTDEGNEENTFDGGIPQTLFLMNGALTRQAISAERGTMLHMVANSKISTEQKIEHLFLASVARKPTARESQAIKAIVERNPGNETQALQDIWWALLNSNEFILDH